jgi:hypothetical protein
MLCPLAASRRIPLALGVLLCLLCGSTAFAADTIAPAPPPLKADTGDTAWMLTSSALVLMMTGPGLALFYSGLVRRKNVLATMMQSFILMAIVSVVWAIFGYSLAFGEGNKFFGSPTQYLFLNGVTAAPHPDYGATIPHTTWMIYQLMFAIITPGLICRAHEVQQHGGFLDSVAGLCLLPAGPHGVGQGWRI